MAYNTDPIFQIGMVPRMPWCDIQKVEMALNGRWDYFINDPTFHCSGWVSEDRLIEEIHNNGQREPTIPEESTSREG
jgi:hypothetical protein